jgi:hypothetical protein
MLRPIAISSPSELLDHVAVADRTVPSKFDSMNDWSDHLRRAADVEGAHGELRARLADRLRRDDADRLAHVDRRAAGEIAPVALAADAVLGLAGQHRADAHLLDAGGLLDGLDVRSSISVPGTITSPVGRIATSSAAVRPRMRWPSEATTCRHRRSRARDAGGRCRNRPR